MRALRWWSLLPATVAAWYATFITGMFAYSFIESYLCPQEELISGICINRSIRSILDVTSHVFVAASAIAVVVAAVSVAPNRKKEVAWLSFVVGAAAATYFGVRTHDYHLLAAAIAGGLGTLILFHFRVRSERPKLLP